MPRLMRSHHSVCTYSASTASWRAVKPIRGGIKVLGHQPGIGRPVEELPEAFREWVIDFGDSGYVARYRIGPDGVTILAVRHQKEVGF